MPLCESLHMVDR